MKIKEKILAILKDEALVYDETEGTLVIFSDDFENVAERLVNLFKSLIPKERDEINSPFSNRNLTFVDGWNACREKILKRIEEVR